MTACAANRVSAPVRKVIDGAAHWTAEEIQALRDLYAAAGGGPVALSAFAERIGRNRHNVCRKARELGLTNPRRRKSTEPRKVRQRKYATDSERRRAGGERMRRYIAEHGHPRGALGMRHSDETKAVISLVSRRLWRDPRFALNSDAHRQRMSDSMHGRMVRGEVPPAPSRRGKGGARADLGGLYLRSRWEANYARYLNFLVSKGEIALWEYEAHTFIFEAIKRGCRSYTPDFRVELNDGTVEWHEVKGWMDQPSRTRLARMARYFPEHKVIIIDAAWFKSAAPWLRRLLPGWETDDD